MENLGIATPTVKLKASLPNVGQFVTKTNFDSSAHNWPSLQNSPFFSPLLIESIVDPAGTFAALIPSKRVYWINNYLGGTGRDGAAALAVKEDKEPFIVWTQINEDQAKGTIVEKIIKKDFPKYVLATPQEYDAVGFNKVDYQGPTWLDNSQNKEMVPNDEKTIEEFKKWITGKQDFLDPNNESSSESEGDIIIDVNYVQQSKAKDGLWWGMQSSAFLGENMPFWINFYTMRPPTSADHDTFLVVSLGDSDKDHRYDIYLSLNNKPRVIDWLGGKDSTGIPQIQKEFEAESSRLWSSQSSHNIGIMTIAGRLVILVDGNPLVYSRIDKSDGDNGGKLLECKIAPGSIKLFGSNSQLAFNVSPMTFAKFGAIALPVPVVATGKAGATTVSNFKGVDYEGHPSESVCHLPTPPSSLPQKFGCDCEIFEGNGGEASPKGFGFHRQGKIGFYKADKSFFAALPSTEFYSLQFWPSNTVIQDKVLEYGGAPYYFRLKGIHITEGEDPGGGTEADITNTVISINETVTAPDYFHAKKSLDVVCYDEGGSLSNALISNQSGIVVTWGWGSNNTRTFTGVITGVSTSQRAGMETVSIRAEDYFHILQHTPIINSPFYDGMVAYYAIKDMAERASLNGFTNNWKSEKQYFLPAGYSFSKPQVRYSSTQTLFDCMMDIIKRFEAFLYFDEDGKLVINKLPGGLFSNQNEPVAAEFFSDPTANADQVILEEKQVEVSFDSTVNVISAMTLERDTRNPIIYVKTAKGSENNLLYKKVHLLNQSALGELEVCRNYVENLSERLFYPILKTRWKTASTNVDLMPLEFVNVDGLPFRLMSMKRSFSAETNDLTTSYEGEWLGGKF